MGARFVAVITGETVRLRAPEASDVDALARLRSDEGLQRLLAVRTRGTSVASVQSWLERIRSDQASLVFVVSSRDADDVLGYVQITAMDTISGHAMLGICIAPDAQGRGVGGQSIRLIESYLERVWKLRKVVLNVLASNTSARGMYEHLGYEQTGVLHEHFFYDGQYEDVVVMERRFP
jgi:RimJ/RimL family protein N-acetyltransferase